MATLAQRLSQFVGRSRTDQTERARTSDAFNLDFLFQKNRGLPASGNAPRAQAAPDDVIAAIDAESRKEQDQERRRARRTGRRSTIFGGLTAGEGLSPGASLSRRSLIAS